jgi:hypothetical protein
VSTRDWVPLALAIGFFVCSFIFRLIPKPDQNLVAEQRPKVADQGQHATGQQR